MKTLATALILTTAACASHPPEQPQALPTQDSHVAPSASSPQHEWLLQLVGDWEATSEAIMEPGTEPARWETTESVRSIGTQWVVAEGAATTPDDPLEFMLTLGYDPAESAFVGTWVDSMQSKLWSYRGQLDSAQRVLTLEAEGPAFNDPTATAQYMDQIEWIDANHRRMTSSVLGDNGAWEVYMKAEYRRKR